MLSGNCTEALSIQANVTLSYCSAKLINNGIAPLPFPTAIELSELLRTWSAEFVPLQAHLRVPWGSGLKSALLNSTAVPPAPPRSGVARRGQFPSWEGSGVGLWSTARWKEQDQSRQKVHIKGSQR